MVNLEERKGKRKIVEVIVERKKKWIGSVVVGGGSLERGDGREGAGESGEESECCKAHIKK